MSDSAISCDELRARIIEIDTQISEALGNPKVSADGVMTDWTSHLNALITARDHYQRIFERQCPGRAILVESPV